MKKIKKIFKRQDYIVKKLGLAKSSLIHFVINFYSISIMIFLFNSLRVNPLFSIPFGFVMGEILYFKHLYEFLKEKKF